MQPGVMGTRLSAEDRGVGVAAVGGQAAVLAPATCRAGAAAGASPRRSPSSAAASTP